LADLQTGVTPGLARRDHADQRRARIAFGIGAVAGIPDVVAVERGHVADRDVRDRRGDATGEIRGVEFGDGAGTARAAADRLPEPLAADAKRRDDADAGDDDPRDGLVHLHPYTAGWHNRLRQGYGGPPKRDDRTAREGG